VPVHDIQQHEVQASHAGVYSDQRVHKRGHVSCAEDGADAAQHAGMGQSDALTEGKRPRIQPDVTARPGRSCHGAETKLVLPGVLQKSSSCSSALSSLECLGSSVRAQECEPSGCHEAQGFSAPLEAPTSCTGDLHAAPFSLGNPQHVSAVLRVLGSSSDAVAFDAGTVRCSEGSSTALDGSPHGRQQQYQQLLSIIGGLCSGEASCGR
jgi:hypothetical protein